MMFFAGLSLSEEILRQIALHFGMPFVFPVVKGCDFGKYQSLDLPDLPVVVLSKTYLHLQGTLLAVTSPRPAHRHEDVIIISPLI